MELAVPSSNPERLRRATVAEWLAIPAEKAAELLRGRIVYKAFPSPEHGRAQRKLGVSLDLFDRRPGEAGTPGGWWLSTEVDLDLGGEGVRPDLLGWRRDRVPRLPSAPPGQAVTERPDWVGEVLSPSTAARDLGDKMDIYHAAGVPHSWVIDPANRTLVVYRRTESGYLRVLGAGAGALVRAEPFEAIDLHVEVLFDDEGSAPA
ncbi:MAG: Uma2 family endonuclease [Byssovorax sp.]